MFVVNDPGRIKRPNEEFKNYKGWRPWICREAYRRISLIPDTFISKLVKIMKPPFMHTEFAFLPEGTENIKEMVVYSMTYNGLIKAEYNFSQPIFGFVKIKHPKEKIQKIMRFLDKMVTAKTHRISRWKTSFIPQICRWVSCMQHLPKPNKTTIRWTCSEFTCYILQKAGVIPNTIHASYVDSSELYIILRSIKSCDTNAQSPIKYPAESQIVKNQTSADYQYTHNMPKRKKLPLYNRNNALSSRVLL